MNRWLWFRLQNTTAADYYSQIEHDHWMQLYNTPQYCGVCVCSHLSESSESSSTLHTVPRCRSTPFEDTQSPLGWVSSSVAATVLQGSPGGTLVFCSCVEVSETSISPHSILAAGEFRLSSAEQPVRSVKSDSTGWYPTTVKIFEITIMVKINNDTWIQNIASNNN